MKTYTIKKVDGSPEWGSVPVLAIDQPHKEMRLEDTPVRAWAQIAYNDTALLVHEWAVEPEIRAEYRGLLDEVCEDSCLELFFCPMEGDERYFNIEYNPNTARFLGMGSSLKNLVRLLPDNDGFSPQVIRTADGWEIFYQVPFEFIRRFFPDFAPKSGKTMRVNCSKCGNLTRQPHWLTWSPIPTKPLTFHSPKLFGVMTFE